MKNCWLTCWAGVFLLSLTSIWLAEGTSLSAGQSAPACTCGCGGTPRPFCAYRCDGKPCTGKSSSEPPSAAAVAAKGCTCGCGGTPRPACAHSCSGNPCTGAALNNSRVIIGEVVENQPSSFSVVGSNGNSLTGFVVEFDDGQQAKTDGQGEGSFTPKKRGQLKAQILDVTSTGVRVLTAEQAAHAPTRVPRFTTAGTEMSVTRAGLFDGRAENTRASIGDMRCAVMAEAPHQAILYVPAETQLGPSQLHIEDHGQKLAAPICVIRSSLHADKLKLARDESTQGRFIVEGADESLVGGVIRIRNLSPEIVSLALASNTGLTLEKRIEHSMIQNGHLEIPFNIHATRGGTFSIVGGVFDPKALATATCSCGCGGTPRPACAHSCGGNPCTGASIKP